jgi:hypothetical protein
MTFKQSWAWWLMPVTPAHKRLSQEDWEFEASLGYIVRPCLKTNKQTNKNQLEISFKEWILAASIITQAIRLPSPRYLTRLSPSPHLVWCLTLKVGKFLSLQKFCILLEGICFFHQNPGFAFSNTFEAKESLTN